MVAGINTNPMIMVFQLVSVLVALSTPGMPGKSIAIIGMAKQIANMYITG
jgi:hypothetical protein